MLQTPADVVATVEVQRSSAGPEVPSTRRLARWAEAALSAEDKDAATLCIRIVDQDEARRTNAQFRGVDRPTNVLSFPVEIMGLPDGVAPLGDLLLCAPLVAREAAAQGKPEADHWAHLVVHGVLHLLGYDHQSEEEARAMEGREIDILERLGIPNPYVPRTADP